MVRNVCEEDLGKLSELLGKPIKEDKVDFELSMLDEVGGEIQSAFVVGMYRVPSEIGGETDDDFDYHEVLGVYTKKKDGESLSHALYEACVATNQYIYFWLPWTEEYEKLLSPLFIEEHEDGIKHLYAIPFTCGESKYKHNEANYD